MSDQESLEQRFAALQESLEQRLAAVEAENAELRARLAANDERQDPAASKAPTAISRRRALAQLGGVAAAAGVTATAAALATNVPSARAADGGAVILGQNNSASHQTVIHNDATATMNSTLTAVANISGNTGAATGVEGVGAFGQGTGVYGHTEYSSLSPHGMGVWGSALVSLIGSPQPNGIQPHSGNPYSLVGVMGQTDSGEGVVGFASDGAGVVGFSLSGLALRLDGTGRFAQIATLAHAGPPTGTDGTFHPGEMIRDANYTVWFSVEDPSSKLRWVRPGFVNGSAAGGALNFLAAPVRIIGANAPGAHLSAGSKTTYPVAGHNTIPADAVAIFGNVNIAAGVSGPGFVTVTAKGGAATTNTINFTPSDVRLSNFCMVRLSGGAIDVHVSNNVPVDFSFDCVGYVL